MSSEDDQPKTLAAASDAEAELEAFRQRWREEVSARSKKPLSTRIQEKRLERARGAPPPAHATAGPSTHRHKDHYNEEIEPKAYHDLPDKEDQLKLGTEGQNHDRDAVFREPNSALEHYERAVEKETQGNLGESIRHYRKAFKLDDGVHEAYKRKHFPPSAFVKPKPTNVNPSNAPSTVPRTDHHSLRSGDAFGSTLRQLVDEFSTLRIEAAEPETSLSSQQPCPIAKLPEEILTQILTELAIMDVASFTRTSQVCKRMAYLVLAEESIWKHVSLGSEFGFTAMHYDFAVEIEGDPINANDEIARYLDLHPTSQQKSSSEEDPESELFIPPPPTPEERHLAFIALSETLLQTTYTSSWRQMFRSRPRIRFNGCYISTVNYTRAGATSTNTLTWGVPVHVVTYFRYLRFFRDGTAISLLTTAEPQDVVHHLSKPNLHAHRHASSSSLLPSSVMKDALRGRWRLSGPTPAHPHEVEGDIHIETEGAVARYTYKMLLAVANAGKGTRNNKLAWKGFWSRNRLTDDWGEFGLRNDRAFYWSRVRSYGVQ
ncbi:F-box pof7 [Lecanosticta acicola]|uniref:F-box pof7 n=1 Tax=Lecanosticta acicola TaxID=111012 RepID=A0AAI8YZI4_9PEZI|nr:F-box pof7 [Lecanosticta acicola]